MPSSPGNATSLRIHLSSLALGLEATFDTATNPLLGGGKNTLGPQIFGVFFKPPGGGVLVAPAYQYVFDIGGEDARPTVKRSQFDLFYLWLTEKKNGWVLANPQAVIDPENDTSFALGEFEYGRMMYFGISSYTRASVGIGEDRPYDYSFEVGFKVIYR